MAEVPPPPPYSSPTHFKGLYEWINANLDDENWTDGDKMKFLKATDDALNDEKNLEKLKKEMDQLATSSTTIKQVFSDVASRFKEVHNESTNENFKSKLEILRKKWDSYGMKFKAIETDAKKTATEAYVIGHDFATDFADYLTNSNDSLERKIEEIETYKKHVEEDEIKSTKIKKDLDELVTNLGTFNIEWQGVAKEENGRLTEEAKALGEKIKKLDDEIDSLTTKINTLIATTVIGGVATGICIIAGFFCPLFWYGAIIPAALTTVSAIVLANKINERTKKRDEREAAMQEKDKLEKQQNRINALLTGVNSVESKSQEAIIAIGTFQDVWQALVRDLDIVLNELKLATETGSKDLAHARIRTAGSMYKRIAEAMKYYASLGA
ncbi:hypothetical protein AX15_000521 [Amanita polypyramis BW_CC]|nr:hypothetical protein AX15_000521 [Amanita polypyramis BW_CC]